MAAVSVLIVASAFAQVEGTRPSPFQVTEAAQGEGTKGLSYGFSLVGRSSYFESDTSLTKDGLVYGNFFGPGLGVSGEFELATANQGRGGWWWGGYLSGGVDIFAGGGPTTDGLGVTVTPGTLTIVTAFLGPKIGFTFENVYVEAHLGAGWAHYFPVKATIDTGTGPLSNRDFLGEGDRWAGELGARFGWGSSNFFFDLGFGFRLLGSPPRGRNADALVSPQAMSTFSLEFGLAWRN